MDHGLSTYAPVAIPSYRTRLRAGFRHLLFDFVLRAEAEGADEGEGAYMPASVLVGQVAAPPLEQTDHP